MSTSSAKVPAEVHYPESDGQPMGETGIHVYTTMEVFGTIKFILYRDHPSTYVASDMFFYYEEGNPRAVKAPDIMVIRGVSHTEERRTFKLWVENRVPSVVFEITSADTRRDDTVVKRELYARLGVEEYFLFDPLGEYLNPQLRGFRLEDGRYAPLTPAEDGSLESRILGVRLRTERTTIRFVDPRTNTPIASFFEQGKIADERKKALEDAQRQMIDERKKIEKERRNAARQEKKAEAERKRADREAKKAEAERRKAEAERQKAETLEAEVRRLRALLGESGSRPEG